MSTTKLIIPSPKHAESLARLCRSTYEETFIGVSYYTRELVEGYTQTSFTTNSLLDDFQDPKIRYFLALLDDQPAAYAKVKEREPAACLGGLSALYLERLYVDARHKRRRLGTLLMQAVYDEARARNYQHIWLSVWEHNPSAQDFYRSHGFYEAGSWDWEFESGGKRYIDKDFVYVRRLDAMP